MMMGIKDIQTKRAELQQKVLGLIREFERETLCIINNIEIKKSNVLENDGLVLTTGDIKIEVQI